MAKTMIKGRFATAADAATVHQISDARRQWLDREVGKAIDDVVMYFTPLTTAAVDRKRAKRNGSKRSAKTVRHRAKRK
ncbi:MAG: hypothetical protein ACXWH7_04715 [Thermoanaerobaculia bacterium]